MSSSIPQSALAALRASMPKEDTRPNREAVEHAAAVAREREHRERQLREACSPAPERGKPSNTDTRTPEQKQRELDAALGHIARSTLG